MDDLRGINYYNYLVLQAPHMSAPQVVVSGAWASKDYRNLVKFSCFCNNKNAENGVRH